MIFCAPEPSSSIFWRPRAWAACPAPTLCADPASPARPASTPRSESDTVSCGFFFAPMIPLSDG